jgi:histone deacetylase 6
MDIDEDVVMGGLSTVEPAVLDSLESTEPPAETVDPNVINPHALEDAAPSPEEMFPVAGAISPSPPRVGSRTLPSTAQDDPMEETSGSTEVSTANSFSSDVPSPKKRSKVEVVVHVPAAPYLPYASSRTGLVYDARMRFHAELNADEEDIHPEDPRRIWEIYNELVAADLVDERPNASKDDEFALSPFKLWRIPTRSATPAEITLVHSPEHFDWVDSLHDRPDEELIEMAQHLDSVYLHKLTMYCALLSAGGAIEACRAVVTGHVRNAIAVIRPPGHHAEHNTPGGFCFFNNVCIAAKVCQQDFPEKCRKILILDWDVHHGNGVQQAFESDPNVLYISLHVHKDGKFYPNGPYGNHLHVGLGDGVGKTINIPWPCHGMKDGDYIYAFEEIVMPVAQEFEPDLVIISAGFDAAEGDLLGGCHITPAGYAHMAHMLKSLANGRVCVCLEGGYNLRSIAKSALAVTRTLMGEPPDRLVDFEPSKPGIETVQLVKRTQSKYWKCLFPRDLYQSRLQMGGERLHDILRRQQMWDWFKDYQMTPLYVHRDKKSKSFENQVLATPDYADAKPLLVIFHDPPETIGAANAVTNKLEPHNIIITDVAKTYVDWAVSNGFAVVDVNIPHHVTDEDDKAGYVDSDSIEARASATRELATYVWENYIE